MLESKELVGVHILLSGLVLDLRSRGCWFKPYMRRSAVSLSKTLNLSLLFSNGSTHESILIYLLIE